MNNGENKMTISARSFLRLQGDVYAVVYADDTRNPPVAQAVRKTLKTARKDADHITQATKIYKGAFVTETTIEGSLIEVNPAESEHRHTAGVCNLLVCTREVR